eukprot:TRINITY_DN19625_c0_g1_i1.p1 TRINITY_DN19625_c0_g1~~TRINITY_DN19625_c0_g1_i1.p1  ORF type:complete len:1178 (+),score=277.23 TRINITY_DN19625_c0_g1_i1:61-3594(+)
MESHSLDLSAHPGSLNPGRACGDAVPRPHATAALPPQTVLLNLGATEDSSSVIAGAVVAEAMPRDPALPLPLDADGKPVPRSVSVGARQAEATPSIDCGAPAGQSLPSTPVSPRALSDAVPESREAAPTLQPSTPAAAALSPAPAPAPVLSAASPQQAAAAVSPAPPAPPPTSGMSALAMANGHPPPPPPGGPLYKCAICEELVYESQLDYHVQLCPDPADGAHAGGPPPPLGVGPLGAGAGLTDGVSVARSLPPSIPEESTEDVPNSPTDQKSGNKPQDRKQSELEQHHQAQSQRSTLRRSQLIEEMRRKEEEECTFQPKTLPRGTPRTCAKSSTQGESRWSQRNEQRMRSLRLKQVEAQAYADVTHRPKISRFAQVWSQRRQEDCPSHQGQSVFERLYAAAVQSRLEAEAMRREAQEALESSVAADATSLNPRFPQRRIPTSELLYSDALDRRERRRTLAERQEEEAAQDKFQVLGRSRRYYWQMLERQVKSAYESVAKGEPCLRHEALEEFLVSFGCLRPLGLQASPAAPRPGSGQAPTQPQVANEERIALCEALWRHLDPQNTGSADVLTLTVFFHVLMGAVDEATRGHTDLSALAEQQPPQVPHHHLGLPSSPGGEAGSGSQSALAAISEEDAAGSNGTGRPASPEEGSAGEPEGEMQSPVPSPVIVDDEGRRIVELLVRFDPGRLRAEFKTLYMQRLYYQWQQASTNNMEQSRCESEVVSPEIDERSRQLAEKLVERERCELGTPAATHADVMLYRHQQAEARKEERREKAKQAEVEDCTFRPKTRSSEQKARALQEGQPEVTPKGVSRNQVLYARAMADRERKEAIMQAKADALASAEAAECTFRPNTARSVKSYKNGQEPSAPAPRGFYESRQRMRVANEAARLKQEQRENRLARVVPAETSGRAPVQPMAPAPEEIAVARGRAEGARGGGARSPMRTASRSPAPSGGGGVALRSPRAGSAGPTTNRRAVAGGASAAGAQRPLTARGAARTPMRTGASPSRQGVASPDLGDATTSTSRRGPSPCPPAAASAPAPNAAAAAVAAAAAAATASAQAAAPMPLSVPRPRAEASARSQSELPQDAYGQGAPATTAADDEASRKDEPPPLLYVDVNVAPGKPLERIVLREGQSVSDVAAEFASKHVLTPVLAQRLHGLLNEVLQRQEQSRLQTR